MPSVTFSVRWPDGEDANYYSPSTIVYDFLTVNKSYTQSEFATQVIAALDAASERVYQKFGFACSAAADEKYKIENKLASLASRNLSGNVTVKAIG